MRSHQQEVLELVEVLELAQRRASLCMVRVGLGWLSKAIGCDGGMLRCCYGLAYYLACGCGADADADGDGDDFTLNGSRGVLSRAMPRIQKRITPSYCQYPCHVLFAVNPCAGLSYCQVCFLLECINQLLITV